jgi:TonB family protein
MKTTQLIVLLAVALAASARVPAAARRQGGVQHFSKDGLSFDYPPGWTLDDKSKPEQQHIILRRPDSSALIMVIAQREPLQNVGQLYASRNSITRPYVENLARQLGAKVPENPDTDCLTIGESFAPGYRLAGRVGQEPSTGEVYAVVKGQRLVHLVYVRYDRDEAAGAPAWKTLADTLKADPPANPSPDSAKMGQIVAGGVLNGKVSKKPAPDYPSTAKAARASGTVVVQVTVDETGEVISAEAVSGHPLLRVSSEDAARRAKFAPTTLCGRPVKVSGVITYNFVLR